MHIKTKWMLACVNKHQKGVKEDSKTIIFPPVNFSYVLAQRPLWVRLYG